MVVCFGVVSSPKLKILVASLCAVILHPSSNKISFGDAWSEGLMRLVWWLLDLSSVCT